MNRHHTEPIPADQSSTLPIQVTSLINWTSSSSFGSTAPEERRADKVFDQIEDLLADMMIDQEQHRLHCRVLEGSVKNDGTSKVFTAVVIVTPPMPKP